MSLKYSVRPNAKTWTDSGNYTFKFGEETYKVNYEKYVGVPDDYEYKYGYQDQQNPKRIKWRILLNSVQDKLNNLVITDDFSDNGQVLVEVHCVPSVMHNNQTKSKVKTNCSS